ncbi:hypothetical protein BREVNS_0862 [Brevinematales bacterium NS]|nr:hypothetical protein BREVNS_0862 [Brevinematales bacterium NS]
MHGYFLPLFGSGAAPLKPRFFLFTRVYLSFLSKKNRLVYYGKEHFYTAFCFLLLS